LNEIDHENIDWTKVDKETYLTLSKRMEEYREACKYMMEKIGDRKRAVEFLTAAENL